jgi:pyridoxine 5-phosphate synthase
MRLGVNVDHVATLRQARKSSLVSVTEAARICESSGADGIVVHLREDRRHIQDKDVFKLKNVIRSHLNLEMSINKDIVDIATRVRPDVSTLVPERRQELTTEGGLDVQANESRIRNVVSRLKSCGINVSLFIDPVKKQIMAAERVGADIIELHTGRYAQAKNSRLRSQLLKELKLKAYFAKGLGLCVAAGHGLDYTNTKAIAGITEIEELNIGYSIICRALFVGLESAVRQIRKLIDSVR